MRFLRVHLFFLAKSNLFSPLVVSTIRFGFQKANIKHGISEEHQKHI
jgi:hypothetical protein